MTPQEMAEAARGNFDTSPLRWHSHPDARLRLSGDTVRGHSLRVRGMVARLSIDMGRHASPDLLFAAEHHDDAEAVLGDMPGPAKDRFPALAAAYAKAELQVLIEMGLTWNLTRDEAAILDLADKLDAQLWAMRCGVDGPEWEAARAKLRRMAERLGPRAVDWLNQELDATAPACNT